ncbi:unnamed protein product [Cylicocyclus nassatus]|uniref:Uncharacterized protein n=1 Tax=Cylicocyclus nassatus TaxID=53992 RepID=A0AA36MCD9_CYLNA|nr:unnamed protein product [Cylicocyclus nassatus]
MFFFSGVFIICLVLKLTNTSEIISYIEEEDDVEAPVICQHLNITQLFHSDKLRIDNITVEHIVINKATSSREHKVSKNQIFLIPTLTVYNNVILDVLPRLNISPNTTVLFDDVHGSMESVREEFGRLPVSTNFVQIALDPIKRQEQIKNVAISGRAIIVAETTLVESFVKEDVTPFRCEVEDCPSMNLFWIRPYATGKIANIRDLREFLVDTEIGLELNYSIRSSQEVEVAFYFDVMDFVFKILMNTKNRLNYTCSSEPTKTPYVYEDALTALNSPVPEYGAYKQLSAAAFYEQPPFVQKTGNTEQPYEGYCIDLIELIRKELNFNYTIYEVEDGTFGTIDQNGNWNGLIGALVSGSADIALAPLSVTAERENDVDFTVPYYDLVGTTILMRRTDADYSLFKFMKVLEWPVWLCILAAYILTSLTLWLFDRFSPYSYTNNRKKYPDDVEKREFTLKECLWFCMTSLTPQGGGEAPKNISGRLAAATWWLFGFIIIASYTANLAAFLTVSRLEQPISSLDDLAKQYKIEYAPIKGSSSETYFRRMAEIEERFYNIWKEMSLNESLSPMDRARLAVWDYPVSDKFTNMWRYMQESRLPNNMDEAIQRVLTSEEGFAFIGDATEIRYAALTNCQLQQIGTEFSRKPYAIAVQSGHVLKDRMSSAILVLLNQRRLETLKEKWWSNNPRKTMCADTTADENDGISIENIGGVFIVILGGIILSVITLAVEYFFYRKNSVHINENHKDVRERRETNGTSIALRNHNAYRRNSMNCINHVTSFGADNAGFQY